MGKNLVVFIGIVIGVFSRQVLKILWYHLETPVHRIYSVWDRGSTERFHFHSNNFLIKWSFDIGTSVCVYWTTANK